MPIEAQLDFESIATSILAQNVNLPAASSLRPQLGQEYWNAPFPAKVDTSLVRLLGSINLLDTTYFLTALSAIHIRDILYGAYDTLEIKRPEVFPLNANRYQAITYVRASKQKTPFGTFLPESYHTEVAKVRKLSQDKGIGEVCLIDQFSPTGKTLAYGATILSAAGIPEAQIKTMPGYWYLEGLLQSDKDVEEYLAVDPASSSASHTQRKLYEIGCRVGNILT